MESNFKRVLFQQELQGLFFMAYNTLKISKWFQDVARNFLCKFMIPAFQIPDGLIPEDNKEEEMVFLRNTDKH